MKALRCWWQDAGPLGRVLLTFNGVAWPVAIALYLYLRHDWWW